MIFGVGKLRVRGLSYAIIYMILHLATVIQYLSDGIYRASIASRSKKYVMKTAEEREMEVKILTCCCVVCGDSIFCLYLSPQ